jgi:molecular chaperone Hsp33
MPDYAVIAQAYDQTVRIYAAQTNELVETARTIHETWPTATAAFGRFLTVSAMMGLMYKDEERITLRIKGDGPIKHMLIEANPQGEVRGEIGNPHVYMVYEDGPKKGKLNVGTAVGRGFLHVTKDLRMRDYFTSSSELQTGEIADDFTYYFTLSEQTPASVGLGVLVDTDQSVLAAGGYILQLMPNVTDETIQHIESVISNLSVGDRFDSNQSYTGRHRRVIIRWQLSTA